MSTSTKRWLPWTRFAVLDGAYAAFVPGHGPAVPQIAAWAAENTARLVEIREAVAGALAETDDVGQIIRRAANHFGMTILTRSFTG